MLLACAIALHGPDANLHTHTCTQAIKNARLQHNNNVAAPLLIQAAAARRNISHPPRTGICVRQLLQGRTPGVLQLRVLLMTLHCSHNMFDAVCRRDCSGVLAGYADLCDQGAPAHTYTHIQYTRTRRSARCVDVRYDD